MPRESPVDKYRRLALEGQPDSQIKSLPDLLKTLLGDDPLPTQLQFILDPVEEQAYEGRITRIKGYMGPLGCAKTATLCATAIFRALLIPGSRILVSRLTYGELEVTTQERLREQLSRLPPGLILDYNKTPPATITVAPIVAGNKEPSTFIFHSLDDPQKLASVELTDAYVDEAREVPSSTVHLIETRCGRRGKGPFFLGLAFNPTSDAHWLYKESRPRTSTEGGSLPPYIKLYRPLPKENIKHLPEGYYESLAKTMPPEMRRRLIEGEWGSDFSGKAVYGNEFDERLNVDRSISYDPNSPVFRFWDFGYNNPCCLIVQKSHQGHINVLYQFDGSKQEIEPFLSDLRKRMLSVGIPEPNIDEGGADYGDPAANQHSDKGQTSQRLASKGVFLYSVPSRIDDGLALVRLALTREVDGKRMLRIHPRCERLVQALRGGYRYKERSEEQQPALKPFKDDYYDHCCDALRYGVYNLSLGDIRSMLKQTSVDPVDSGQEWGPGSEDDYENWDH